MGGVLCFQGRARSFSRKDNVITVLLFLMVVSSGPAFSQVWDMALTKTASPNPVAAGETLTYTLTATNLGPSTATNVDLLDTLPLAGKYLGSSSGGSPGIGTGPGGTDEVVFSLEDLAPGQSTVREVVVRVDADYVSLTERGSDTLTNSLWALWEDEGGPQIETIYQDTTVIESADLLITKIGKPDDEVLAGEVLTYTIVVDNLGPSYARGVAVKDILQSSGEFDLVDVNSDRDILCRSLPARGDQPPAGHPISATSFPLPDPPDLGVLDPAGIEDIDQRLELDCVLAAPLEVLTADGPPNSGRWILTVRVRARETQDINNIGTVTCDTPDPDATNNTAEVSTAILDTSDLLVEKAAFGEVQVAGQAGQLFDMLNPGVFPADPYYTDQHHGGHGRTPDSDTRWAWRTPGRAPPPTWW